MNDTHEPLGSATEEAAKLFGALSEWAQDMTGPVGVMAEHLAPGSGSGEGPAECRWCPLCRTAHALREASPEIRTHLATAAASLMQAAAGLLQAAAADPGAPSAAAQRSGEDRASSGQTTPDDGGVEQIPLDDGPWWPEEEA